MSSRRLHVMVDLVPGTAYARGVIAGAARCCADHSHLRLRLPSSEWELIGDDEGVDGVIAGVGKPDTWARAARFGKPVVNVSSIVCAVPYATVTIDNVAAGRMAADHLLSGGYRTFAYHMESTVHYSVRRLEGFRQRLAEAGHPVHVFDTARTNGIARTSATLRQETIEWLAALPKPIGLFVHNDNRASMLLDICRDVGLTVPERIGVIGMDNDELLVMTSDPTLTSIDPAADVIGYRAVTLLLSILSGGPVPTEPVYVPPRNVVPRQSTDLVFPDDELLTQAVRYIRQHATDPIDVNRVLEHVPLSRRSLERRFRERLGRSPGDEIRRLQIEKAKRLLTETQQTLTKIAHTMGYSEFRNFATAFRRTTGVSPTAYRRSFGDRHFGRRRTCLLHAHRSAESGVAAGAGFD